MTKERIVPKFEASAIGRHSLTDYGVRFAFGAGIALVAAILGLLFGPKLGGVFLGFPAILPASLTLIEKKDGKRQAAVDAAGAILGAIALIVFAVAMSLAVVRLGVAVSLAAALALWVVVAVGLYAAFMGVHDGEPDPPS